MNKAYFLRKLRLFLADPDGKVWNDTELSRLLDASLEKYCLDSGFSTGVFDFFHDSNGLYYYPEDFGRYLTGWNETGEEILPSTSRELFIRRGMNSNLPGSAQYIYDDLGNHGEFILYPNPAQNQTVTVLRQENFYGEVIDDGFGVYITSDYGTTFDVIKFEYYGTIYYRKICKYEEVKDYMSVISYALHLAYNSDSDFANADMASYWKSIYQSRIGVFSRVLHNNAGRTVMENFY